MIALSALVALAAAPVALRFDPPLDRVLRFETSDTRHAATTMRFVMVQRLAFTRVPTGYRLSLTLERATADAPAPARAVFDATMAPMRGVPIHILLDAHGKPVDVEALDTTWAGIVTSLEATARSFAARTDVDDRARAGVRALVAAFAAMPADQRREQVLEPAWQLLGFVGPTLAPGASAPYSATVAVPGIGERAVSGHIRLAAIDDAVARFEVEARTAPATGEVMMTERSVHSVSRATGLTTRAVVTRTLLPLGGARIQTVRETRLLP